MEIDFLNWSALFLLLAAGCAGFIDAAAGGGGDRKSTRLNSSH